MIRLTQRRINYWVFGLLTVTSFAFFVNLLFSPDTTITGLIVTTLGWSISGLLWFAYWRGWEYARHVMILLLTVITAFLTPIKILQVDFSHIVYVCPALALVLVGPFWVLGSALTLLFVVGFRVSDVSYFSSYNLTMFVIIIGCMVLSRMAVDNVQLLEAAKRDAEEAKLQAEAERTRVEAQASELMQRNEEQQRLLELVSTLETPSITVGKNTLLVPLVGALDTRRTDAITLRLLEEVNTHRTRHVILDVAGVTILDTRVAQMLIQTTQALRLLGCQVTLTGISASMASSIMHLGLGLEGLDIARSPEEVLARS